MKFNELLINGGVAHSNAVSFYGRNYQSRATRMKNGEINVEIKKIKALPQWLHNMLGVPFLRGFADTIYAFYMKWWIGLIFLIAPITMNYRIQQVMEALTSTDGGNRANFISGMLTGLLMVSIILKVSPMGKYHAAEHVMHNLYLNGRPLTIEEGRKMSYIHEWCGTGCVFLLMIYSVLMFFIPIPVWLKVLIWFPFYGEVIMNDNKHVRMLLIPFKFATYVSQYLTTSKPKDEHLEVSLQAFQCLLEKEENLVEANKLALI